MKELELVKGIIEDKLDKIREKENKTLNERTEYKKLQEKLVMVQKVINILKEELNMEEL